MLHLNHAQARRVSSFSLEDEASLNPLSDRALVDEMRRGCADALGVLFHRYHRLVFKVAKRILRDRGEAEDLMQEVFIEVYGKARLYEANRGSVKVWLLQYAYHRSFNRRKYLALRSFYDAPPTTLLTHLEREGERGGRGPMDALESDEVLQRGIRELTTKERQIIELVAFDGLTVREASERMQESYVNGRNRYYRGLKKLREFVVQTTAPTPASTLGVMG